MVWHGTHRNDSFCEQIPNLRSERGFGLIRPILGFALMKYGIFHLAAYLISLPTSFYHIKTPPGPMEPQIQHPIGWIAQKHFLGPGKNVGTPTLALKS